eukprot:15709-Heterococcus_DN1.PRE.4
MCTQRPALCLCQLLNPALASTAVTSATNTTFRSSCTAVAQQYQLALAQLQLLSGSRTDSQTRAGNWPLAVPLRDSVLHVVTISSADSFDAVAQGIAQPLSFLILQQQL